MSRGGFDADACWQAAFVKIAEETEASPAEVRDFLDSRHGGSFARMVIEVMLRDGNVDRAIDALIGRHQQWRTSWNDQQAISSGLPCLIGWVLLTEAETTK